MKFDIDFIRMDEPNEFCKMAYADLERVYTEMGHNDSLLEHSSSRPVEYGWALQVLNPDNWEKFNKVRILDAGCGASPLLPFLKNRNYKDLTGIDTQSSFNQPTFGFRPEWKEQFGINYLQANILTYRSQVFDVIFCISVLEHIFRPIDQLKALVQLWENLKDGGHLIVTCDYAWSLLAGFYFSLCGAAKIVDSLNWQDKVYGICLQKVMKEGLTEWLQINK